MESSEIFEGRKVWLKPTNVYREAYGGQEYVEMTVKSVGLKRFKLDDPIRPRVDYSLKTLEELATSKTVVNKARVLLSIDGLEDFDRKEKLIIRVRKYFNSRLAYNTSEEDLNSIIKLLNL